MNILGSRIKYLRNKNNYSQKRVADALGISNVQLSRYESGDRKPDPETIKSFAEFFDVTTDFLLGHETESNELEHYKNKIVKEFPDVDLMFKDMESLNAEDMKEVYEYIKFKVSQKNK
ncbi:helix-turn-helix transcriptional regulator [Cytobacillus sp. OWB-43]|uniref:helix-turn-helix domain-containing protein n=1 Tax=Cytobacillus sp. OWB-43 TaxID=3108468 RepID=UPI002AFF22CA|nr:helix-turn-helix transcriptional regulator [Cytobacillus sp. OWB-43]MEA1855624.1 helix-turn-helix transcriptional regulator [Cytobacillus sp. OWB-43]